MERQADQAFRTAMAISTTTPQPNAPARVTTPASAAAANRGVVTTGPHIARCLNPPAQCIKLTCTQIPTNSTPVRTSTARPSSQPTHTATF